MDDCHQVHFDLWPAYKAILLQLGLIKLEDGKAIEIVRYLAPSYPWCHVDRVFAVPSSPIRVTVLLA